MDALRIAIQKNGRLKERSISLLTESGISLANGGGRLQSAAVDYPLEALFLRDDDIPEYVRDGVADIGIVGENIVQEKGFRLEIIDRLGFARCRLSLAVPRDADYSGPRWFEGRRIATTYPAILEKYLKKLGVRAEIHVISGSVEIAPGIGLADGIFDIVSTGSTLTGNGLREVETAMESEAVLVSGTTLTPGKKKTLENLLFRIRAVLRSADNKYILLNAPNSSLDAIIDVLPGMKSPTVMPLAAEGWSSVHSVLNEKEFWSVIDQLKELGAQGILVIPIEKMIL